MDPESTLVEERMVPWRKTPHEQKSPEDGPFQKERIVFQTLIFSGQVRFLG